MFINYYRYNENTGKKNEKPNKNPYNIEIKMQRVRSGVTPRDKRAQSFPGPYVRDGPTLKFIFFEFDK